MERSHSWVWVLLVLLVQVHVYNCVGCLDEERIALLEIKASFNYTNGPSLPLWGDGEESDCCAWAGITCGGNITPRVTNLTLDLKWEGPNQEFRKWYLNASLFLPFQELRNLDLSWNYIAGCVENQGFERLWRLRKLEVLNLNHNYLNKSILSSLNSLSSIKTVDLSRNELQGSFHIQELAALRNLEVLDLSDNQLENLLTTPGLRTMKKLQVLDLSENRFENISILQSLSELPSLKMLYLNDNLLQGSVPLQEFGNLGSLEVLDLYNNSLNNRFVQDIGIMPSLRVLSLGNNGINGTLQIQGLCKLKNLQELILNENNFEGNLPSCLRNLTTLRVLDLSDNHFVGNIASFPLTSFSSLEYLSFSSNHFQIPVSAFSLFANFSKLKILILNNNEFMEETETNLSPKFHLKILRLSNCSLDKVGGAIRTFLLYQSDLRVVDLSNNNLKGRLPTWLLENNTRLNVLILKNNSFTGPLSVPSWPNLVTSKLDLSHNLIDGQIPLNITVSFPKLGLLDLANNHLSGEIPIQLAKAGSSLTLLRLSNNNLKGRMLPPISSMTSLCFLYLDNNQFTGNIPDSLSNSHGLWILDISENHISETLPKWIGNMSELVALIMANNHLEGTIPVEFCKLSSLKYLDLSENNISGSLPSCLSSLPLRHVQLQGNGLTGPLMHALSNSSRLVTLDLSNNYLTGRIPNWIGKLPSLRILHLKGNHFEGNIPIQLCQLTNLSIMDLSFNNLSGHLPFCLFNITFETRDDGNPIFALGIGYLSTSSESASQYLYQSSEMGFQNHVVLRSNDSLYTASGKQVQAEFTIKRRSYSFEGRRLNFVSAIDISSNRLTGEIPHEIGNSSQIHSLNLSHNCLHGPIPWSFSNMKKLESLDLSFNNLHGTIPSQLIELNSLAIFTVAYNNLSGKTPDRRAQFATFDQSSYEGNQFLCGLPLEHNCSETGKPSLTIPITPSGSREENNYMDTFSFFLSFAVSYVMVLLVLIAVLYINPYWRWVWFHLINVAITNSYHYFLCSLSKLSIHAN